MNLLNQYKEHPRSQEYIHTSNPQWDSNAVFNKNTVFKVENYGLIKMFFLKFTVTPNGATNFVNPTSPYIIENVFLECNGIPFARVNTTYCLSRIDDLSGTGLYNKIVRAATLQETFESVQTVTLPLFFYVIDGQVFDPSKYQNLTVRCITKNTKEAMGFSENPVSIDIKLVTIYDQAIDKHGYSLGCPALKDSYNIASEFHSLETFDTSKIVKLNNQSRVKSLIFMIRLNSNGGTATLIDSVKLRFTNGQETTYDNNSNFTLSDTNGTNDGKIFKINTEQYTKINGNMNPVLATVNFDAVSDDSTLFIVYEYESHILEQNGMLLETFDESLF